MDALRSVRFDMIFSFIYSPRVGTPAAVMDGQIPHEVSTARFERMINMQNDISRERNERFVSRTDGAMLTARSDSPRPIHFAGDSSLIGDFADIKITRADTFSLIGELDKSKEI